MIDIIIPMHNERNNIDNVLRSIKSQTINNEIQVILVDDASTDNYNDILNKYKDKLKIKYIKNNISYGAGMARQIGIDNSNNEYIIFLDADDKFMKKNSVSKLYNKISEGYDLVDSLTYSEEKNENYINNGDLHGKIYRKTFLTNNKIRFNETRYHEDNAFNNLLLIHKPKRFCLAEVTYFYSNNPNSITKKEGEWQRMEIYISNMRYVVDTATNHKCDKEKIKEYLDNKYNYLKELSKNITNEQFKELNSWLYKYNFNELKKM